MSFCEYYTKKGYEFDTSLMDSCIPDKNKQILYYSDWVSQYKTALHECSPDNMAEWVIRSNKSIWSMFSSAEILVEAENCLANNCFVSFYFCLYYSLFHAIYSLLYMTPALKLNDLYRISHSTLINNFKNHFTQQHDMFDSSAIDFFYELKNKREYYSYNSPMNLVFENTTEDLTKTKSMVLTMYQTLFFHSFIAQNESSIILTDSSTTSAIKHCRITNLEDRIGFQESFTKFFSNVDIINIKTQRDEYRKKRKNAKAVVKNSSIKRDVILTAKNSGKSFDVSKLASLSKKIKEKNKELKDIQNKLDYCENALSSVSLDPSAKDLLCEINSGKTLLGLDAFQFEIDHYFNQLRSYLPLSSNITKSFKAEDVNTLIGSCIYKKSKGNANQNKNSKKACP